MGNMNFNTKPIEANSIATIVHNEFTKSIEMPNEILRTGNKVKIIKTVNLHKSRPNAPNITVSTIMFQNGLRDAYLTTNLKN